MATKKPQKKWRRAKNAQVGVQLDWTLCASQRARHCKDSRAKRSGSHLKVTVGKRLRFNITASQFNDSEKKGIQFVFRKVEEWGGFRTGLTHTLQQEV